MGLLKFVGKKLLMMIPMLLLISFIVFAGLQATGIDPINYMITPDMAANAAHPGSSVPRCAAARAWRMPSSAIRSAP